jgi:hypothetical protein
MQLRSHPLMHYRGVRNWPPAWTRIRGSEDRHLKGEVGTLREVRWPPVDPEPFDRFFLIVEFEGAFYMGCLLFEDRTFCRQVESLLRANYGRSIESIGSLNVSYTL